MLKKRVNELEESLHKVEVALFERVSRCRLVVWSVNAQACVCQLLIDVKIFLMVFGIPFRIQRGKEERVNLPLWVCVRICVGVDFS